MSCVAGVWIMTRRTAQRWLPVLRRIAIIAPPVALCLLYIATHGFQRPTVHLGWFVIPAGFTSAAAGIGAVVVAKRSGRVPIGHCSNCGYPVQHLPKCPECGGLT